MAKISDVKIENVFKSIQELKHDISKDNISIISMSAPIEENKAHDRDRG